MSLEMKVPTVGESISEVTVASWIKTEGMWVEMDEILCELESDKATFEVTAESSGILKVVANEGDTIEIGALLCTIEEGEAPKNTSQKEEINEKKGSDESQEKSVAPSKKESYASDHPSPAAAKMIRELPIDSHQIQGTGKEGRITKQDVLNAPVAKTTEEAPRAFSDLSSGAEREIERSKMSSLRKTVSRRLVAVKNETAMLTTFNEVNMKPIMDLRAKYKEEFKEKHEVGLGFMSFFTKACCVALQEWKAVNGMIDGNELIYHHYCDISIAVSAPKGLVVPVIRDAQRLSFVQIEKEVVRLATRARENKLSIEEMQGGTFTITNGGVFGSMMSTPIINAPQSAILGMHNIVQRPVVENGEVVVRPMMYVALSYDHRIIDGRESVSFLVRVKQLLEEPNRLLLGV